MDGQRGVGVVMGEHALLTPEEAARYLRVTERTVYRLLRCGDCPGVKIGRQWRIRKTDLEACLTNSVPSTRTGADPEKSGAA